MQIVIGMYGSLYFLHIHIHFFPYKSLVLDPPKDFAPHLTELEL